MAVSILKRLRSENQSAGSGPSQCFHPSGFQKHKLSNGRWSCDPSGQWCDPEIAEREEAIAALEGTLAKLSESSASKDALAIAERSLKERIGSLKKDLGAASKVAAASRKFDPPVSVCCRIVPLMIDERRLLLLRTEPVKSALVRFAPSRLAPLKSASLTITPERSASEKSAAEAREPDRFVSESFAPVKIVLWLLLSGTPGRSISIIWPLSSRSIRRPSRRSALFISAPVRLAPAT